MIKNIIIILLLLPWLLAATPSNKSLVDFLQNKYLQPKPPSVSIMYLQDDTNYMVGSGIIVDPNTHGTKDWTDSRFFVVPGGKVYYRINARKHYNLRDLYR